MGIVEEDEHGEDALGAAFSHQPLDLLKFKTVTYKTVTYKTVTHIIRQSRHVQDSQVIEVDEHREDALGAARAHQPLDLLTYKTVTQKTVKHT